MLAENMPDVDAFHSSFEAITELDAVMERHLHGAVPHFVVGGIVTAALRHPGTVMRPVERRIIAAEAADLSTTRPNGTRRDVDVLIGGIVPGSVMSRTRVDLESVTHHQLEASVFAFDPYQSHIHDRSGWISRRLQQSNKTVSYQLGPVVQRVQPESYQPWTLELPREMGEVSVLHPVGHLAAYAIRSVSGLREKDRTKFEQMRANILQHTALKEALHDGPFKEWKQFAETITAIRRGERIPHDNIQPGTTRRELAALRWRGMLLKKAEQYSGLVDFAQKPLPQKILNTFVRAAK